MSKPFFVWTWSRFYENESPVISFVWHKSLVLTRTLLFTLKATCSNNQGAKLIVYSVFLHLIFYNGILGIKIGKSKIFHAVLVYVRGPAETRTNGIRAVEAWRRPGQMISVLWRLHSGALAETRTNDIRAVGPCLYENQKWLIGCLTLYLLTIKNDGNNMVQWWRRCLGTS